MNPFHVVLICIAYLSLVFVGKLVMAQRKNAFELRAFSALHNLFLVVLSSYMFFQNLYQANLLGFSLWGNAVGTTAAALPLANAIWVFYVSKIAEFVDTFIMVLKKNDRQITFLHLYHHTTIFMIWWAVTYYAPGGDSYFSAACNSFVHIVMYAYYFFASVKISIPGKKYITQLQMLQFVVFMIQGAYHELSGTSKYPLFFSRLLFFYMITLLALFMNYYLKEQKRQAQLRRETAKKTK